MIERPLSPYQLLFFNRELHFGSSASNILKGNVRISGANYVELKNAINQVLHRSEWAFLSINTTSKSWDINEKWNGDFVEKRMDPEITLDGKLWSIQLISESTKNIQLRVCLHHCLGDAHSFNLFWNSVLDQYKTGTFQLSATFDQKNSAYSNLVHQDEKIELPTDLGIGSLKRISYDFHANIIQKLIPFAKDTSGSTMAFLLERLEEELKLSEKHLEIPIKIGIALRNRKNKTQKNSFPTCVNFLPLLNGTNLSMQQRILTVFRYQDYPLLDFLDQDNQRVAFNALFSYQKEHYEFSEELNLSFHFEPSLADDNILGIHLLEFGDKRITLHLDYRTDIASDYYWKNFVRNIIRKITALILTKKEIKSIDKESILIPHRTHSFDFWHWFDHVDNDKIALVCGNTTKDFGELKREIELIKFESKEKIVRLKTERTAENIVKLLAAWRNNLAVTYHDLEIDRLQDLEGIAYIAKTSGTAGESKTILISFNSLKTLIPDWITLYQSFDSRHLCLADQRFDVFFGDLLRSILSGETLVLATEEQRLDADKINRIIQKQQITHVESTPSFLSYLLPQITDVSTLKTIICGSESIFESFYRLTQRKEFENITFFNSYGLTECSIDSAISPLKKNTDGKFPSGFVVGDQMISIRDKTGALKPMGIWGEIHIEGECVGMNLASQNLRKNYATGDLGMITPADGLIVGGRINNDFIKVNGRRVPAGLIEVLVSEIDTVKSCLCLEVDKTAVLFIYGNSDKKTVQQELLTFLSKYQLPDAYFICEKWPINQNGKADRKQLIEWFKKDFQSKPSWMPSNENKENILFECLSARNKSIGTADDSLISFGWNSIELLSLANELNLKGLFVPHSSFIQEPTIQFILDAQQNRFALTSEEKPEADDFDLDDILSILNDN